MPDAASSEYLRTQVMTASPAKLRLMLLDGALKFANQALMGYESKDLEASSSAASQCRDIVIELATGLNTEADPQLAERMQSVFMFIYRELVEVSFTRDIARLGKAIELLEYERETWALVMERAGGGAGEGGQDRTAPDREKPRSISVEA